MAIDKKLLNGKRADKIAEAISSRKGRRGLARSMSRPMLGPIFGQRVDLEDTVCEKCAFGNTPCEEIRQTIGRDCWMAAGKFIIVWEERDYEPVESI